MTVKFAPGFWWSPFRVMQSSGSRAILDEIGAEMLEPGQFMALLGEPKVVRGMTANPGDEELVVVPG